MAVAEGRERRGSGRSERAASLRGPHAVHDVAAVSLPVVRGGALGRLAVATGRPGRVRFRLMRSASCGHLVRAGFEEGGRF